MSTLTWNERQNRMRSRISQDAIVRDRTCPDCRGRKLDRYGFDCRRCGGEGEVDE